MSPNTVIQLSLDICVASFALFCAFIVYITRKDEPQRSRCVLILLMLGASVLIFDSISWIYSGLPGSFAKVIILVSNSLIYFCNPLMVFFVVRYLCMLISNNGYELSPNWSRIVSDLTGLHIVLLLVCTLTRKLCYVDEFNFYHRGNAYILFAVLGFLELIFIIIMILSFHRYLSLFESIAVIFLATTTIFTNIVQTIQYGFSLTEISTCVSMIMFFMAHEIEKTSRIFGQKELLEQTMTELTEKEARLEDHEIALVQQKVTLDKKEASLNFALAVSDYLKDQLSKKEQQLTNAHIQISVSQMQPHFIFNALGSIEQLCRTNPQRAAEATHQFAVYLRTNLIALSSYDLKDFPDELSHIKAYVWLEKMRFGDDLCYTEDIRIDNFQVPVLSVQPLVENAIKHGMMGVEEGVLHVNLKTWEEPFSYCIEISDDGAGFDVSTLPTDSRIHVGLINVRHRLEYMCNGQLLIDSTIGKGSKFTIIIPKKDNEC